MPTASHRVIRQVKRAGHEPSIHGTKLWKSSCLIIDYLHKNPPEHSRTVLDAGCGWGITGMWCAKKLRANVISLDADPAVFPYLEAVASLNGVATTPLVKRFEQLTKRDLGDIGVGDQRATHLTAPLHDVEDARRHTGFDKDFRQFQGT